MPPCALIVCTGVAKGEAPVWGHALNPLFEGPNASWGKIVLHDVGEETGENVIGEVGGPVLGTSECSQIERFTDVILVNCRHSGVAARDSGAAQG